MKAEALFAEIQNAKKEIPALIEALAENSERLSDAEREKVQQSLKATTEQLGEILKTLEGLEKKE